MKHIFILNPAAGKGKSEKKYLPLIHDVAREMKVDYEIHRTINIGDGERYTRQRCENRSSETELLRFYACGGDGTLNEVANGAYGFKNVEIAFIPAGTGNDFARNFEKKKGFLDIKSQILGKGIAVDLLRYTLDDQPARYCINMLNIGFDCHVVIKMDELRKYPFIAGTSAYISGVGLVLLKKKTLDLTISMDDGEKFSGSFLMMAAGNGKYSGGGFKGLPEASVDDGRMDISIIKDITRRELMGLIGHYKKGTHLETKLGQRIVDYKQCRTLYVEDEINFCIAIDGETAQTKKLFVEVEPKGIVFSVPL